MQTATLKKQASATALKPADLSNPPAEVEHLMRYLEPMMQGIARSEVGNILSGQGFMSEITGTTMEIIGNALRATGAARRGLSESEFLVPVAPYNEAGDIVALIPRWLPGSATSMSMLLTFGPEGDPNYTYCLFQENSQFFSETAFLTPEDTMKAELERQIAEFCKPNMAGKSVMLTVLTIPGKKQPNQPNQPADTDDSHHNVTQDLAVAGDTQQPQHDGPSLDDIIPPEKLAR